MGRTKIPAGRMAREPSVPKLIAVETSTPPLPSQPRSSPSPHHLVPLLHTPSQTDRSSSLSLAIRPRPETQTRLLTLRSRKKIAPPLTQEKQHKPPVFRPHDPDPPEHSRRRAAPQDFVFPAPKRKKARMASGPPSLPPDIPKAKMQLQNRPNCDKAPQNKKKNSKPKHEKTVKKEKKTEQHMVDEAIEDVASSPSNYDSSSLGTNVDFLTTMVLVNHKMLKEQQAQLNRLEMMVRTR